MRSPFYDTAAGYFVRLLSGKKLLKYPEELPGFKFPYPVEETDSTITAKVSGSSTPTSLPSGEKSDDNDKDSRPAGHSPAATGDLERGVQDEALTSSISRVIHPVKTKDGVILVDWYSTGVS